ncbi:MAG TPA: DUF3795 domain-containing protein [Nitrospirota bacterium]
MKTKDDNTMIAPCGLLCSDCGVHKVKDDPSLRETLIKKVNWKGAPCPGCRTIKGKSQFITDTCATYACVSKRGYDFCYECPDFPCAMLNPAADRAGDLPHNIKVFNLCCIKEQGLAAWLQNASDIKNKYFFGKMALGKGPLLK